MTGNEVPRNRFPLELVLVASMLAGCGTTKTQTATQQLLMSDAVDQSVASIDFDLLKGRKVYLDTQFVKNVKGVGFVNAEYIVGSLRQQMISSRCLLQDKRDNADYIVEARVGALGTDGHTISYGVPASNMVTSAASVLTPAPQLPSLPEISLARRNERTGAAKISVFAYHRESGEPVWQSGIAQARSDARDTWILGAGPFQRGSIYNGTRFAGGGILGLRTSRSQEPDSGLSLYRSPRSFANPREGNPPEEQSDSDSGVELADHEETAKSDDEDEADEATDENPES